MKPIDVVFILVAIGIVVGVVIRQIRKRNSGQSSCGCEGCPGCSPSGGCGPQQPKA